MSKEVSISVIIPVYNSEKFISECINSVLNQTYKNFEIVCVNDGSKDNSKKVIKEYIRKFPRKIKLINQNNQGSGFARNTGIENSLGKYVIFLDSDDSLDREMLEKLYKNIEKYKADVAVGGFQRVDETTGKVLSNDMVSHNFKYIDIKEENMDKLLFINPGPCNKIHKRSIFENVRFTKIPVVDDLVLMLEYIPNIKRYSFVPEVLYYYKIRRSSSSNSLDYKTFSASKECMLEIKQKYIKQKLPKHFVDFLDKIVLIHIGISMLTKLSYRQEINMCREIKTIKDYLNENFPAWRKISLLNALKSKNSRFLGLYFLTFLHKIKIFIIFIVVYKFMNEKMKKDIKW